MMHSVVIATATALMTTKVKEWTAGMGTAAEGFETKGVDGLVGGREVEGEDVVF